VQPYTETSTDERLPAAAVLRRYKIVDRTLKRWLDNPDGSKNAALGWEAAVIETGMAVR
jgi:hypothetical protein